MAGFLLSGVRTLHRTPFDDSLLRSSPLRGQRDRRAVQTPAALVRVRAPLFRKTSLRAGFLLSGVRTLHQTPFDDSLLRSSPLRGQRDRRAVQTPAALVRVRAPLFRKTSLRAGFLLSGVRTLHQTPFDDSLPRSRRVGKRSAPTFTNAALERAQTYPPWDNVQHSPLTWHNKTPVIPYAS